MLDKLALTSPRTELTQEIACQLLMGHYSKCTLSGTKYHQTLLIFHKGNQGGHLLSLHIHPRHSHIAQLKIEINPTHFTGFREMTNLLGLITEPNDLNVNRIDHAVDLEGVAVQDIYNSLILSRKKCREVYKDGLNLESFYFGKSPERLLVYDKTKELKEYGVTKTRIELQQFREKIPFNRFIDLPKLQTYKPFEKLQFKKVKTAFAYSLREQQKQSYIQDWLLQKGAQATYKAFNRHSNFKRDIAPFLTEDTTIPNLDQLYQQNLNKYFS